MACIAGTTLWLQARVTRSLWCVCAFAGCVRSISGSIRQHGAGMLNTTINIAYQFLSQKFHVFCEFLYDEYIKAALAQVRF